MNNEQKIKELEMKVEKMEEFIKSLSFANSLPLSLDQALSGRGYMKTGSEVVIPVSQGGTGASTLSGIVLASGTSPFTAVAPLSGANTFYGASSSGGSPTVGLNFSNGVLVSIS